MEVEIGMEVEMVGGVTQIPVSFSLHRGVAVRWRWDEGGAVRETQKEQMFATREES